LDAINEAAPGISILEDAAQAHLAQTNGRPVGALGAAGCFSFYPTKNMTTIEGGMITTNDPTLADRSRSFANHGREPDAKLGTYDHVRWGTNARMTDVSAAIGLVQLAKLPAWTEARRRNARRLSEGLGDAVATPSEAAGSTHVFHQYTIRIPAGTRDRVLARLKEQGVGAGVYYPRVLYHYPHLAPFSAKCPEAERAALEVLSVPVHPRLSDADVDRVVSSISAALSAEGATKPGPAAGPRRPLA
jgi:dTDP-4-amino-4,6-dideoxygalactose transaminase